MGARSKTIKPTAPNLTLGVVSGLSSLIPQFRTPTYADMQRITGVLEKLASTEAHRQSLITSFFKDNDLPEEEVIDATHPLSRFLFQLLQTAETKLSKTDVAAYDLAAFNASVDGLALSYADRNFLMFWLVK
jgi:hypothetical protein